VIAFLLGGGASPMTGSLAMVLDLGGKANSQRAAPSNVAQR